MSERTKSLLFGFLGALALILIYQAYLDHHRIMKTCENLLAATGGKFTCW